MIIKSMARKEASFSQLIDYMASIEKSEECYNVYQNLYSRKLNDIEKEFQINAALCPKRKNGNQMYHEILSISKAQGLTNQKQKEILRDIALEYAKHRAKDNLIFGTLHDDHDEHLHYHLLISANGLGESRKTRLSKVEFDSFKKGMETYVLEKYPELEQQKVINKDAQEKLSNRAFERKRRTGKVPERDRVKAILQGVFQNVLSKKAFFEALDEAGLEFYIRGKTFGVKEVDTQRKYRLKTLGLMDSFEKMSARIELHKSKVDDSKKDVNQNQALNSKQDDNKGNSEALSAKKEQDKRKAEMDRIRCEQQAMSEQSSKREQASKNEKKQWVFRGVFAWVKSQIQASLKKSERWYLKSSVSKTEITNNTINLSSKQKKQWLTQRK